jgi:hypothetical protein
MNPVLVFDMDETLIESTKTYTKETDTYNIKEIFFNERLLEIIRRAKSLKEKRRIDAILLLTNNKNINCIYEGKEMKFLNLVDFIYSERYKVPTDTFLGLFDNIYTAEANNAKGRITRNYNFVPQDERFKSSATAWSGNLNEKFRYREKKDIKTIKKMLEELNISKDDLQDRIYFFDDEAIPHAIKEELEGQKGAYITITPPFGKGEDKTDLEPIEQKLKELESLKGGTRRKKKKRTTLRK